MILDPWITPHGRTRPPILFSPSPAGPLHSLPFPKTAVHFFFSRWQHIQSKSHKAALHRLAARNSLHIKKYARDYIPSNYSHITHCLLSHHTLPPETHTKPPRLLSWHLRTSILPPPRPSPPPPWTLPCVLARQRGPESRLDSSPDSLRLRSQLHNRKHHHFSSNPAKKHPA